MGLLRGVARTAVVAGTATAVSNRVSRRQANRWNDQQDQVSQDQPVQDQGYAPDPEPSEEDQMMDQLQKLGQLKEQGILTEDEFTAKKKQLLGI
jgi:hypothetical protein